MSAEQQERIEDGNRFCVKCGEFLGMICDPFGRQSCGSNCFAEAIRTAALKLTDTPKESPSIETRLPSDKWARSTKQPKWALCLDPDNRFFGWKCYDNHGRWVSGTKMTLEEIEQALQKTDLIPWRAQLEQLKTTFAGA